MGARACAGRAGRAPRPCRSSAARAGRAWRPRGRRTSGCERQQVGQRRAAAGRARYSSSADSGSIEMWCRPSPSVALDERDAGARARRARALTSSRAATSATIVRRPRAGGGHAERGGDGRLADAALAGDDEQRLGEEVPHRTPGTLPASSVRIDRRSSAAVGTVRCGSGPCPSRPAFRPGHRRVAEPLLQRDVRQAPTPVRGPRVPRGARARRRRAGRSPSRSPSPQAGAGSSDSGGLRLGAGRRRWRHAPVIGGTGRGQDRRRPRVDRGLLLAVPAVAGLDAADEARRRRSRPSRSPA